MNRTHVAIVGSQPTIATPHMQEFQAPGHAKNTHSHRPRHCAAAPRSATNEHQPPLPSQRTPQAVPAPIAQPRPRSPRTGTRPGQAMESSFNEQRHPRAGNTRTTAAAQASAVTTESVSVRRSCLAAMRHSMTATARNTADSRHSMRVPNPDTTIPPTPAPRA